MAAISLVQAQAQLDAWLEASLAVALSQEYEIETGNGRRRLKRADTAEIQKMIGFWTAQVEALTTAGAGGRRRTRYVVPE